MTSRAVKQSRVVVAVILLCAGTGGALGYLEHRAIGAALDMACRGAFLGALIGTAAAIGYDLIARLLRRRS